AYVTVGATAHDLCSGVVTLTNDRTAGGGDASGAYPLGGTSVVFTADDGRGHSATCSTAVSVVDTQPPTLSLITDPATLWPPNHGMVPVNVQFAAQDTCGAGVRVELVSVTSSEPDDAQGGDDGQTSGDIQNAEPGTADATIDLRAERAGKSSGRTYTLTYRAVDLAGHVTTALGIVTVPHDQGQGPEPLQMRLEPAGTQHEARLFWPAVSGATAYDVIRGDLAALRAAGGVLHLGTVAVLARGTTATSAIEPATIPSALPGAPPLSATPPVGGGFFYLIQQTTDRGAVGYGTESAPWPRVPDACDGGCPGTTETVATSPAGSGSGGSGTRKR
ncbi:MAG TPA: hypothetical protein VMQ62_13030, partial [Dongiaceae bacterium]|nr:hypothetical protein [Dongiaceae bacterium]